MPKSLVPAKKRPTQTARPLRSGSATKPTVKKAKPKPKTASGASKPGGKPAAKPALGSKPDKLKVKKPAVKKEVNDKKKVVPKKSIKVTAKKTAPGKCKKKVPAAPKKADKEKTEKIHIKKEKDDSNTIKEPVEVVIHVKKPKAKSVPKNDPKTGVASGKIKKPKSVKNTQMKKDLLKKLTGKMDGKLESVVNTILEVAVVKKVHAKNKPSDETHKEKKKTKEPSKKKSKDAKLDQKKTEIKEEPVDKVEIPEIAKEVMKEPVVVNKPEDKSEQSEGSVQVKELNDEDIRKMEIKKEIIDEFIEEEEKQSKAKLERKKPFLKKPKMKPKDIVKKEDNVKEKEEDRLEGKPLPDEGKEESGVVDISKQSSTSNEGEKSCKKGELVNKQLKAKSTKGKKGSSNDKSDNEEKLPEDEELKAKRMKLYGFWNGPKRHRVASLNAIAKVHCLYENESRGAMNEMLDKSVSKGKIGTRKIRRKNYKESESDERKESDDSVLEVPKRSLRTAPGMRGVGRHYDVETSSSSAPSSSSSESEVEDDKPEKPVPSPKVEPKKQKVFVPKGKLVKVKKEEKQEAVVEETIQEEPEKKVRKRRRRCELMMDLKDMVVRKRMASLNASAMLAATYSVEKKPARSDDDRRKKSAQYTTTDSTPSSTEVEPETSDEEVILSGSSKKVAVIVNQDTDVTITGLYVNSTTRSTRHCSITGMQYRISSTSHTQTESTAVTTETVIHTSDQVSVSHSWLMECGNNITSVSEDYEAKEIVFVNSLFQVYLHREETQVRRNFVEVKEGASRMNEVVFTWLALEHPGG
ncbi:hypothetical protein GE061_012478 [Apolygus lucorum]|uniref:Uncharacterized protein n=1 Tax=Apolygus lucorum TaxID=248454 RepID=A0A6A4JTR2_APOLU|nr:hypothetical protein GE061_012478 [Apolygus lucorum]